MARSGRSWLKFTEEEWALIHKALVAYARRRRARARVNPRPGPGDAPAAERLARVIGHRGEVAARLTVRPAVRDPEGWTDPERLYLTAGAAADLIAQSYTGNADPLHAPGVVADRWLAYCLRHGLRPDALALDTYLKCWTPYTPRDEEHDHER